MSERIWIMGASDGIGAALARIWAARGADVILSARSADKLADLAQELSGAEVLPCDVTDRDSLNTVAKAIIEGGKLDRAITLAALYDPGKVMELEADVAARIVAVNLTGSFNFARAAVPLLRPGGQLALTGSVAGYVGLPQGQIYSATKAGVINLAESLRAELAQNVDVRLISPGFVDTRLTQKNDFDMPALMQPAAAAEAILSGLDKGGFEVHFPRRLTLPLKLLRALPYGLALRLTKRLIR
ncbi:SDR family NAD(P)-dependent oxidoreductase [Paracoccus marinaquae]|uniref:SDR family NAD(P)-dependent oxidoreductase n=1 Tax=Paracoccus marinaquae TaxID=2841926 RepID=A0ABS6AGH7_9RHOB|nr:SDR family NAD(P)-dependent oxidoreductase [Paracoccus marinaquae]MBU3029683.1 SDR family NAD(P)-dependent oxidoreductase [Paracoccus marinaquae]